MTALWAGALLFVAAAATPLDVQRYLDLSVEMLRQGNEGWAEVVEQLRRGEDEAGEAVSALKQEMAAAEDKLLSEYGATREGFERYYAEHRNEVDGYLLENKERQKELIELTEELRAVLTEYARLSAGPQSGEPETEAPPPD